MVEMSSNANLTNLTETLTFQLYENIIVVYN